MDAVNRVDDCFCVPNIYCELDISNAMFKKWRAKYSCIVVSMISRINELEEENRRLE